MKEHKDTYPQFILDLQELQNRAHQLKLYNTAHALNSAMNKAGWERVQQKERENDQTKARSA